ncbi:hypothetical protein, partial [Devosia sp. Leaf64]|uniref:hypothetical protein n=1 Tax=Devosia sp. Leaf64 TaxID=1736229 RepID=UPI000AF87C3A
ASDYVQSFKMPLASYGASTDGLRTGGFWMDPTQKRTLLERDIVSGEVTGHFWRLRFGKTGLCESA